MLANVEFLVFAEPQEWEVEWALRTEFFWHYLIQVAKRNTFSMHEKEVLGALHCKQHQHSGSSNDVANQNPRISVGSCGATNHGWIRNDVRIDHHSYRAISNGIAAHSALRTSIESKARPQIVPYRGQCVGGKHCVVESSSNTYLNESQAVAEHERKGPVAEDHAEEVGQGNLCVTPEENHEQENRAEDVKKLEQRVV